jgi:hypothetical protein
MAIRNLFGELGLEETLQSVVHYLKSLAGSIGQVYPDTAGRIRVNVETGTLSTVTTVTNINGQSGYSTAYDQYCQMMTNASYIRSRITTS